MVNKLTEEQTVRYLVAGMLLAAEATRNTEYVVTCNHPKQGGDKDYDWALNGADLLMERFIEREKL